MKNLEKEKHEMIFTSNMNLNYHTYMENKYSSTSKYSNSISILLSSTATLSMIEYIPNSLVPYKTFFTAICAFFIAVTNTIVMAFKINEKASDHSFFRRGWTEIASSLSELELKSNSMKKSDIIDELLEIKKKMSRLHKEEPSPNKKRLDISFNETCKQMGLQPPHKKSV